MATNGARKVIAFHNGTSATRYTGKVTVEIELVTPELAAEWLGKIKRNRKLTVRRAESIARDIAEDRWQVTNQGIGFDTHGTLVDGQHRLNGIVLAKKAIFVPVFRNLSPMAIDVVDHNMKTRSVADLLALNGITQSGKVAMIARTLHMATAPSKDAKLFLVHDASDIWEKFREDIEWSIRKFTDGYNPVSRGPVMAALAYAHSVFPRKIEEFATSVYKAVGFTEGMPARTLHLTLTRTLFGTNTERMDAFYKTLRAAQFHCIGKDCAKLQVTREGFLYFKHFRQQKKMDTPDPEPMEASADA